MYNGYPLETQHLRLPSIDTGDWSEGWGGKRGQMGTCKEKAEQLGLFHLIWSCMSRFNLEYCNNFQSQRYDMLSRKKMQIFFVQWMNNKNSALKWDQQWEKCFNNTVSHCCKEEINFKRHLSSEETSCHCHQQVIEQVSLGKTMFHACWEEA
jgi:hypothetical protein